MARSSRKSSRKQPSLTALFDFEQIVGGVFLVLAVLLGGASAGGYAGNAVLQALAALLIAWGIVTLDWAPERKSERLPLIFALVLAAYMLIQLIPLPPFLWTHLPGRERVVEGLSALGVDPLPWMPISLLPGRTLSGVTAMLPPIAALILVLRFQRSATQGALWALFGVAVVSAMMGLGQISGGSGSPLYLYDPTNLGLAVGFFSNANHLGTLMVLVLPLVAGVAVRARMRSDETKGATIAWIAAPAVMLLALLVVPFTESLAAVILAVIALVAAFLIFRAALPARVQMGAIIGGLVLAALLIGYMLLNPDKFGFGTTSGGTTGMGRPHIWQIASHIVPAMLPFGSGFGSFDAVFRQFENPGLIGPVYANHAHSDLIEIVIEGGLVSVLLLLAFLVWYVRRTWKLWMSYSSRDPLACAASVAVGLVLLHSLIDYPLRTSAIAVPFAFCLGLMARAQRQTASIAAEAPAAGARHLSVV
jgi:O-antigen ligase